MSINQLTSCFSFKKVFIITYSFKVMSERIRMEEALANDAQVDDLLTTLSETKQILNGIEYKQQEQDGHIKLLDSVLSMRSRR